MAYLEVNELYTHIYEENVEAISRGDDAVPLSAIDAAMQEAAGYLTKYDMQKIFAAQGKERNAILLLFVKDIAAWHFVNLCNAGVDIELREKRYDRAIEWLKDNENKSNPNLPAKNIIITENCPQYRSEMAFGSNRKRDNHF
ncbi:MAG: DUF1320 domain-containing protein [Bacteroides graminisolvens]|jgi:hypothetical protein|uniref:DUF1320 domain-containing protein n=1 Tax=Bacteroides graminisolvens TaxID=477666 RepID=UPI003A881078